VANQSSGAAYGLAKSQVGVFGLSASSRGAAFLERDLSVPEEWRTDPVRCREAGVPEHQAVISKGELARRMLARAVAAHVPAAWVVGDPLSGDDEVRVWLEDQHRHSVRALPQTQVVWVAGRQQPIGYIAALSPLVGLDGALGRGRQPGTTAVRMGVEAGVREGCLR
jgi:SRSO17 transposase